MNLDVWRYEARRLGWPALVAPCLATFAILFLAGLAQALGPVGQVDRILSGLLDVLPIAAGLAAASVASGDGCLELQLSVPTSFRRTVARRLAITTVLASAIALVFTIALAATNRLVWPVSLAGDQLIWLVPVAWMVGIGAAVAAGLRGPAVGSGVVAVIWIMEQLWSDLLKTHGWLATIWLTLRFDPADPAAWYTNRACLIGFAALLLGLTYWLLGKSERLLRGEAR